MRRASLLLVLLSLPALADGAFPNAMQVLTSASAPAEIRLATTFGLVSTEDAGASWRYVCEPSITGGTNVILYAQAADGTLLALADKLWRSSDAGCSWSEVAPASGAAGWSDLFLDPATAGRAFAVSFMAGGGARGLWESSDEARTFPTPLAIGLDGLVSVESAASDPGVLYGSNAVYSGSAGPLLARSGDAGATWQSHAIAAPVPSIVRILAVAPDDPDSLWLRATHVDTQADDLWASSDGGETLSILYSSPIPLTGFARTDDGALFLSDGAAGLLVRKPGATAFTRVGTAHLRCLGRLGARLYGCGDSLSDPFNLAWSDDQGQSWTPILRFPQLLGPQACVQSACASDWVYQQTQFAQLEPKPGSGCASASGAGALALLGLLLWRRRRSHRMVA